MAAVFSAPIRTGGRVDMQRVLATRYAAWQELWADSNGDLGRSAWAPVLPRERPNRLVFDVDDFQGAGRQPWIAVASPPPGDAFRDLVAAELGILEVDRVELRLYDFGIATFLLSGGYKSETEQAVAAPLERIEALSSRLAEVVRPWCRRQISTIMHAVPPDLLLTTERMEKGLGLSPPGTPMWVHRLLLARPAEGATPADLHTPADPGHFCFAEGTFLESWAAGRMRLWVAHGTSFAELPEPNVACVRSIANVIDLGTAYWAGAQELGSLVLRRQHQLAEFRRLRNARALHEQSFGLIELHDELALFRTLVSDQLTRLPLTERNVFDTIAESWRFEDVLREVERRREAIAEVHDQALRRVQADEAGRLNLVVFGIAMISAASVVTELLTFIQEEGLRSPDVARTAIVAVLAVSLVIVAFQTLRFRPGGERQPFLAGKFVGSVEGDDEER